MYILAFVILSQSIQEASCDMKSGSHVIFGVLELDYDVHVAPRIPA